MSRPRRLLLVTVAALVVALLVAAGLAWRWSAGGRAQRSGVAEIPGLSAPVEVRWDERGVPYCTAERGEDLAAALGWLHANDRFTQMELGRRLAAGRLAELAGIGERALEVDRQHRTLRFAATAETMWRSAGDETRVWLEAYARGVNAWLDRRGAGDMPPDLVLLGGNDFRPEPWRPQDSLAFVMLMANDLSFWNDRPEEAHYRWLRELGPDRTLDLARGPRHLPAGIAELAARAAEEAGGAESEGGDAGGEGAGDGVKGSLDELPEPKVVGNPGSNNWAVGGSRTASGAPLVANDPHLPYRLPGTWYQVLLRSPGYEAAGMTLPGVPGVVIGRGPDVAWVLTNVMLDDHDLYVEELSEGPSGEPRVRRGDGWQAVAVSEERLEVAGGEGEVLELRATDRGPLLPADPERGLPPRSLAWTMYESPEEGGADPMSALFAIARAESVADVPRGIGGYVGPAQNLVVADRDGGLLWTVLGRVPERRRGDGWLPAPGWDASYGWDGLRPVADNPRRVAPADDLLVTANNRIVAPDDPRAMPADYDSDHRARRIRQLLRRGADWRAEDMAALQIDRVDLYARDVVEAALEGLGDDELAAVGEPAPQAADLLGRWNGRMAATNPGNSSNSSNPSAAAGAPALFALFERELRRAVFGDEATAHGLEPFDDRDRLLWALRGDLSAEWFDDVGTPEVVERRWEVVGRALAVAWRLAEERWGSDPSAWHYGDLNTLTLDHPLGGVPAVGALFRRGPYPVSGSSTTVGASGGRWRDGGLEVVHGASMRFVIDLGRPDSMLTVLPAGQAGHPRDPHYDDQTDYYLAGRLFPFPWSEEAVEAASVSRLTLRPENASAGEDH